MTGEQYALTSSSLIRQIVSLGGDLQQLAMLLPTIVVDKLRQKQKSGTIRASGPDAPVT
jgi:phosphopantetheine adenylyltransferase